MELTEPSGKKIDLDNIKLENIINKSKTPFANSKVAFMTCYPKNKSVFLSGLLSKKLGLKHNSKLALARAEDNKGIVWLYKFPFETYGYDVRLYAKQFRIISSHLVRVLCESFWINPEVVTKTLRLYVDVDNPVKKVVDELGVEVELYQVYDIPESRNDMNDEEKKKYSDYMSECFENVTKENESN
jgi:hypothetical protein